MPRRAMLHVPSSLLLAILLPCATLLALVAGPASATGAPRASRDVAPDSVVRGRVARPDRQPAAPLACEGSVSSISPCSGSSTTLPTNSSGEPVNFTLFNNSMEETLHYTFSCSRTGPVTSCTAPAPVDVRPGFAAIVRVTVSTGSTEGTGSVSVTASSAEDVVTGTRTVVVQAPASVLVTTTPTTGAVDAGASGSQTFTVKNTGSHSGTFTLTTPCTEEVISCDASKSQVTLASQTWTSVTVTYRGDRPGGSGRVELRATNLDDATKTSVAWAAISVRTVAVTVTATQNPVEAATGSPGSASFTVHNTGTSDAAFALSVPTCAVGINTCQPAQSSVTLANGASTMVTVTFNTATTESTGSLTLKATYAPYPEFTGSGSTTVDVIAPCTGSASMLACVNDIATLVTSTDSQAVRFTLTNLNTTSALHYNFDCSVTAPGATCTPPDPIDVPAEMTTFVEVPVQTSATEGTGTVRLLATSPLDEVGADVPVEVLSAMSVVVTALTPSVRVDAADSLALPFVVQNVGSLQATYNLALDCPTEAAQNCRVANAQVTLDHNAADTVLVSYDPGEPGSTGTVALTASHYRNSRITSTATASLIVNTRGVVVTADVEADTVDAGSPNQQVGFTVRNTGYDGRFTLTTPCVSPVTSCVASDTVIDLDSLATAHVTVTYTATVASVSAGAVRLRARSADDPTVSAIAAVRIAAHTVATGGEPQVALVNSDSLAARALCLTISAAPGAAYECGDLRLVHALPSLRTMNKTRVPVLLYNSRFAEPHPLVAVNATLLPDTVAPLTIEAAVTIDTVTTTVTWSGSGWTPGTTRRLVIPVDNAGLATGVHRYTLQVTNVYPTERRPSQVVTGYFVVVNRRASPFGAGWWLAGLEQLQFPADTTTRLWVGGDGSVRVYAKVASDVWAAPAVDRPDTLTWDGTHYVRHLAHGLRVLFDAQGRHVATINRLGHETSFRYDPESRLDSIVVPPGGAGQTYTIDYDTVGQVTITAPPMGDTLRATTLVLSADSLVTAIRDPDYQFGTQPFVAFGYDGMSPRIDSLTDKLGITTSFTYDTAQTLAAVDRPLNATDTATTTFVAAERQGLAPAIVLADSAYTRLDGPRDVPDVTRFWVGRFGAPSRIRDAVGNETLLTTDPAFPALVTRVTDPRGFTTTAEYDARGNLITQTALDPLDGAGDAVTRYAYDGTFDFVTHITQPTGEVWQATYNATTGNRISEQLTETSTRYQTTYVYDPACGLVQSVTTVATSSTTTVDYDAQCNVRGVQTPTGHWTRYGLDALGRVVADTAPAGRVDSTVYDVMGRVVATRTSGPDRNGSGFQMVDVRQSYDPVGRLLRVARIAVPDPADIDTVVTAYRYDWAGRRVATVSPWQATTVVDSTHYDRAGNADIVITRRGHVITMQYDTLNRLVRREVPAVSYPVEHMGIVGHFTNPVSNPYPFYPNVPGDSGYTVPRQVERFAYDAVGHLIRANNGDARVSRTYYPNGLLATEADSLRTLADTSDGGDFTHHIYTIRYAYDLSGRLTTLTVPHQLAPRIQPNALSAVLLTTTQVQAVEDSTIDYTYDTGPDGTGWLATVGGLLPGDVFRYTYTPRGEVETLTALESVPGGVTAQPLVDERTYDPDGRLATHRVTRAGDVLRDATVTAVDPAGRVLELADTAAHGIRIRPTTASYRYSGLGALVTSEFHQTNEDGTDAATAEAMSYDALGNWLGRHLVGSPMTLDRGFNISMGNDTAFYEPGTGRLVSKGSGGSAPDDWAYTMVYDSAGSLHASLGDYQGDPSQYVDRVSYYGADGRLAAADARVGGITGLGEAAQGHMAFEVYRYDALGRRILARVRRWCDDQPEADGGSDYRPCMVSAVRRTVWRGAQELAEIQMPAADTATLTDNPENDTLAVERSVPVESDPPFDANRLYGYVLYVHGLALDQPLAVTRVHYADARALGPDPVAYAVYAPFSIVPLWNRQGHADRAVMGGPAAAGRDLLCADLANGRCVEVNYDAELFPYARADADPGSWQGTLLVDKADATGTYYRRNRSYDPATARFTQEDPIGLAGGLNLYGFAAGDPVSYSDPFGLCPEDAGGDGKTESFSDCEPGTSGWYANRLVTGKGNAALNWAGGVFASCGESVACTTVLGVLGGGGGRLLSAGATRITYIGEVGKLRGLVASMEEAGASEEAIARAVSAARRELGAKFKAITPEPFLSGILRRNLAKYGDELGPTIEWLRARGSTWADIISKSLRTGGRDLLP